MRSRQPVPDVAARFSDLEHARAAIEALENSGVDGDDIKLLGSAAEEAAIEPTQSDADRRAVKQVLSHTARASVVWGLIGAVAGLAVGAFVLWISGSWDVPAWLLVFALLGGFLASTVAAMIGAERSVSESDAWASTFQDTGEGPVWVAVRAPDDRQVEKARRALERTDPIDIRVARSRG
jgi:hypothetical protein